MNRYTVYCTPEQTRKALQLGAPIKSVIGRVSPKTAKKCNLAVIGELSYDIPTAEQMICWLEEQDVVVDVLSHYIGGDKYIYDWVRNDDYYDDTSYKSRSEATLAAIDAALGYLLNNQNK